MAAGEALLVAISDRMSLGVLLCGRVEAAHLASDAISAAALLLRARQLQSELGAENQSEFGVALKRAGDLVDHSA